MRRLVLVFFVVLTMMSVAGTITGAESKSKPSSHPQGVNNTTRGHFERTGVGESSYGLGVCNENYRCAHPAEDGSEARFGVEIPETADYAVYARWPSQGLECIGAGRGREELGVGWARVNQQRGDRWVRVGVFEMVAGDDQSVRFSLKTDGKATWSPTLCRRSRSPEHGDGISHVGIATGKGTVLHASEYLYKVYKVTETRIQYIRFYDRGCQSARRLL